MTKTHQVIQTRGNQHLQSSSHGTLLKVSMAKWHLHFVGNSRIAAIWRRWILLLDGSYKALFWWSTPFVIPPNLQDSIVGPCNNILLQGPTHNPFSDSPPVVHPFLPRKQTFPSPCLQTLLIWRRPLMFSVFEILYFTEVQWSIWSLFLISVWTYISDRYSAL